MSHSNSRVRRGVDALAVIFVIAALPASVWAYKEGTTWGRVVQQGSGCIAQSSSVNHGGDHDMMTIGGQALTLSDNANLVLGQCQAGGGNKWIRGTHTLYLIKARNQNDPNAGYDLCDWVESTWGWTNGVMTVGRSYPEAPCGVGYYALIYCLNDVDTYIQGLPGGIKLGWFNAVDARTQCNVSPNWHPAIHGMGSQVGPQVRL